MFDVYELGQRFCITGTLPGDVIYSYRCGRVASFCTSGALECKGRSAACHAAHGAIDAPTLERNRAGRRCKNAALAAAPSGSVRATQMLATRPHQIGVIQ